MSARYRRQVLLSVPYTVTLGADWCMTRRCRADPQSGRLREPRARSGDGRGRVFDPGSTAEGFADRRPTRHDSNLIKGLKKAGSASRSRKARRIICPRPRRSTSCPAMAQRGSSSRGRAAVVAAAVEAAGAGGGGQATRHGREREPFPRQILHRSGSSHRRLWELVAEISATRTWWGSRRGALAWPRRFRPRLNPGC